MKIVTRVVLLVCALAITLVIGGCGGGGGGGSNPLTYFKASNTDTGDEFGRSVALSDDGATLAVGAYHEDSDGSGESNNIDTAAGAVYVFTSVGGWKQQAYVKAPTPAAYDWFGFSVALSADGNTLAVGAPQSLSSNGIVYVYTRSGSTWTFKQQVTGEASGDGFGWAVALSDDGLVLAVGAPFENTSASSSGALYVYTTTAADNWSTVAITTTDKIKSGTAASEQDAQLGVSIALNGGGTVLAGGANQISGSKPGFARIFLPTGGGSDIWATQSEVGITAAGGEADDQFGVSVSLNSAGDMLAVGAWQEDSNTITDTSNNDASDSGAAYVFVTGDNWATNTETYVKASSPVANDNFGTSVSLNGSGDTLSVGAPFAAGTGTAYRIVNNGTWAGGIASEQAITPPSGDYGDQFGFSVSLSATAGRLVIGDKYEDSAATGINGDKADNSKPDSGAAYVHAP